MGGPMGVYEDYDTMRCDDGGVNCVEMDNEDNVTGAAGGGGMLKCPPAFDCNGIPPKYWHPTDSATDEFM
eukprot:CAMPEP_0172152660 /NCGR_PEP_ID=MMETSP1050-20130122/977_1 /TAXON_ID=233186 /ORGANISM="Cryptomonas curvata, Strain CCAP979/52" /LENGTH=69 /DNA_ID=CAMNT_0012821039 /DNA_START=162 /DNA_END=371 /DNA_ORIENTATION=-